MCANLKLPWEQQLTDQWSEHVYHFQTIVLKTGMEMNRPGWTQSEQSSKVMPAQECIKTRIKEGHQNLDLKCNTASYSSANSWRGGGVQEFSSQIVSEFQV